MGAIASAAMMLTHLGLTQEAARIDAAILSAVRQRKLTPDVGGTLGTRACGEWIASHI